MTTASSTVTLGLLDAAQNYVNVPWQLILYCLIDMLAMSDCLADCLTQCLQIVSAQ